MRITRHRAIAAATAAAIALSSMAITPASAGQYRHYHHGAGNAAVLGAVAGVFGLKRRSSRLQASPIAAPLSLRRSNGVNRAETHPSV